MIRPLHGLRGLAAMSVVVGHAAPVAFNPSLGVVLFFVLSGFLIGKLYLERDFSAAAVWEYAVARFARVYPLFALVVLATAAMNLVLGGRIFHLTPDRIVPHLLLAGAGPTIWTISVEFQFYAIFVLCWALHAKGLLPRWLLLAVLAALAAIGLTLAADGGRIDLLRYLFIFTTGLAIAQFAQRAPEWLIKLAGAALPLLAAAYVWTGVRDPAGAIYDNPWAAAASAALLGAAVLAPASMAARWLSARPLFWLGEISFGIYLLHRHAQRAAAKLLGHDIEPWLRFAAVVALTLAAAQIAHWLVERPARRWLRAAGGKLSSR